MPGWDRGSNEEKEQETEKGRGIFNYFCFIKKNSQYCKNTFSLPWSLYKNSFKQNQSWVNLGSLKD